MEDPLRCLSVSVGSYQIKPKTTNSCLYVYLSTDGLSFSCAQVTDREKLVNITIEPRDIIELIVYFGSCLRVAFIYPTSIFADNVRKMLKMQNKDTQYFDPSSSDDRLKRITFLIDSINDNQKNFLRLIFVTDLNVKECLHQTTANEILVGSTPNQQTTSLDPPVPATKLFTYPPPPQTGGIAVTNEDFTCLHEGKLLNDVIIDFYLKYVFYEKLSDYDRENTHVFSSFFYTRLTHKPKRLGDESRIMLKAERHRLVQRWTRHVDIFSKNYIIIPVNQNGHWFLAIICFPWMVPENLTTDDSSSNKHIENATSTGDQDKDRSESNSMDGRNQNLDENSTVPSRSTVENDSEESPLEAPESSAHPDQTIRKRVPCICIFDSLSSSSHTRVIKTLREYLEMEFMFRKGKYKMFNKNTMQGYVLQCPQQTNCTDCGVFLLQYVESFYENPIPHFNNPIPSLSNWFPKEKIARKREELKELVLSLQKKHGAKNQNNELKESVSFR